MSILPLIIGIQEHELAPEEEQFIRRYQPAGVILFSRNIAAPDQVRRLTDQIRKIFQHTPIIAIDQEGGRVTRTAAMGLNIPSAHTMRLAQDADGIARMAKLIADSLHWLGINTTFAPVLDICHGDSTQALHGRCWGSNSQEVITYAGMMNRNMTYYGLLTCGKHFPGMGRALSDPHFLLPVIDNTLDELMRSDILPFMTLAPELPSIMTSHVIFKALDESMPCTLSNPSITSLLRRQLGYNGIVFTDDLCMQAITDNISIEKACVLALSAGCDLPLICHASSEELRRIADHILAYAVPDHERDQRILQFCEKTRAMPSPQTAQWEELLQKSRELCRQFPDSDAGGPSASPVHSY